MSGCYVTLIINGREEDYEIGSLDRVVLTSVTPGEEEGVAYINDDWGTSGSINSSNIEKVRYWRDEIIEIHPFLVGCEKLEEQDAPIIDNLQALKEWWDELYRA